jgi:hypothetical protein
MAFIRFMRLRLRLNTVRACRIVPVDRCFHALPARTSNVASEPRLAADEDGRQSRIRIGIDSYGPYEFLRA